MKPLTWEDTTEFLEYYQSYFNIVLEPAQPEGRAVLATPDRTIVINGVTTTEKGKPGKEASEEWKLWNEKVNVKFRWPCRTLGYYRYNLLRNKK
jgi:hypothetical protein